MVYVYTIFMIYVMSLEINLIFLAIFSSKNYAILCLIISCRTHQYSQNMHDHIAELGQLRTYDHKWKLSSYASATSPMSILHHHLILILSSRISYGTELTNTTRIPANVVYFPSRFHISKATRFNRWQIDSFFFIDKRKPLRERRSTYFILYRYPFFSHLKGSNGPVTMRIYTSCQLVVE